MIREAWMFGGAFWGILFILIGGLLLLRTALNINLPIFRIVVGLLLVYVGISIMVGGYGRRDERTVLFEERTLLVTGQQHEYNIIFSQGILDFTQLSPDDRRTYEVNTIFSGSTIILDGEVPTELRVSAAFASTDHPQGDGTFLGETTYRTGTEAEDVLIIEASVVFGSLQIVYR